MSFRFLLCVPDRGMWEARVKTAPEITREDATVTIEAEPGAIVYYTIDPVTSTTIRSFSAFVNPFP